MATLKTLKAMAYLSPDMVEFAQTDRNATKLHFLQTLQHYCPGFIIDDSNRTAVANIFDWCLRDTCGELNPSKGIWLYGNIGTGKSTIMKAILLFISKHWLRDSGESIKPSWMNVPVLCTHYSEEGLSAFDNIPTGLDELGTELVPTSHWGNKLNVIAHIIGEMAEKISYIPPIVTTNLTFSEIERKYGARAVDRIGVLYNLVEMRGRSWRKDSDKIWEIIASENKRIEENNL